MDVTTLPGRTEPAFARDLRERALEAYAALPMPSAETEEWRYTDLSGLDLGAFDRAPDGGDEAGSLEALPSELQEAARATPDRAGLIVQRNSATVAELLDPRLAERGVVFSSVDAALAQHPGLLEGRLHAAVGFDRTKLTALHAAMRTGGVFLYVPPGVAVEHPLQSLTYLDADGAAVFPHTVVITGEGAEVTLIDRYASPDLGSALSDAVVEIHAGPASNVRYVALQGWGEGVTHVAVQRALVERDATVRSLTVAFGASLSRTEVESVLQGPGGHSEMLGVYFADGTQHFDHRSLQDHVAPSCTSMLLYKGALKGKSRTIYSGLVRVWPGAQKTDAFQTNRNIVLSEDAKADSIPNLEIEANDVRCGHAASTGPVDADTLFYLQSRGIPALEAERLVVTGFFQEVLDKVTLPEIRDEVAASIAAELDRD